MQPIQPAAPGQPLRASDINAQTAEVRRQGNVNFDGGIVSQEIGGLHISSLGSDSFFAKINKRVSANPFRYGYYEVTRRKNDWVATTNPLSTSKDF